MQGDARLSIAVMNDANVVVGKGAVNVCDNFVLGHFLKIRLDVREVQ